MGNEESRLVDDTMRPTVLEARNIDAVAKYIKDYHVRRIVLMVLTFPTFPQLYFQGFLLYDSLVLTRNYRLEPESAPQPVSPIFAPLTLDCMPTWLFWTWSNPKMYSTLNFSERTQSLSMHWLVNCTRVAIVPPSPTHLSSS